MDDPQGIISKGDSKSSYREVEDSQVSFGDPRSSVRRTEDIVVHAYDWSVVDGDSEGENMSIYAWCLDRDSNSHLIRFSDFPALCYIELPRMIGSRRMEWSESLVRIYVTWLRGALGHDAPFLMTLKAMKKTYYFRSCTFPMLCCAFRTLASLRHCENFLASPRYVSDLGMTVPANVWEAKISSVRKMLTAKDCRYSQWFTVPARLVDHEFKVATIPREYAANYMMIKPIPKEETMSWTTRGGVLAFDIECYAKNHKAMPKKINALDVAYMISCIYQRAGLKDTRRRFAIVWGDCNPIKGSEVIRVSNEMELIEAFARVVRETDPEVVIGYNIMGFDYPYLDARLQRRNRKEWPFMGRLRNVMSRMKTKNWKSAAYGFNSINIVNMDGRFSLDLLHVVRRDFKWEKYDLNTAARTTVERGKHDIKPKQMFEIYEELQAANAALNDLLKKQAFTVMYQMMSIAEHIRVAFGAGLQYALDTVARLPLTAADKESVEHALTRLQNVKDAMTKVMEYCIEDAELVMDMFDKLNIWINLIQYSNILGVTPEEIYTGGQQRRSFSLFYNQAAKRNHVIDSRDAAKVSFSGAICGGELMRMWKNVVTLDVKSMYPSIMDADNMCHTTLIPPELYDQIPPEKYIVREWDEISDGKARNIATEEDEEEVDDEEDDPERDTDESTKQTVVHHHHRFVTADVYRGILPFLAREAVEERNEIKKLAAQAKDPLTKAILAAMEWSVKVKANSLFGFTGAQRGGILPIVEIAMSITARGRELWRLMREFVEKKKGGKVVYGDSVTSDTPILVKRLGTERYISICNLIPFSSSDTCGDGKERRDISEDNVYVWSNRGWTRVRQVIRHKTSKQIYRVLTRTGLVDVTEDHSLLRPNGEKVSPNRVSIDEKLMHADLPPYNWMKDPCHPHKHGSLSVKSVTAQLYHYLHSEGKNVYLSIQEDKVIMMPTECSDLDDRVVYVIPLGTTEDYVYDLETENHHFSAGIGRLVVHNTDSIIVDLNITDSSQCNTIGKKLADEVNAILPKGITVVFEKAFKTVVFLTAKKYGGILIDKDTDRPIDDENKLFKRGITTARNDSCHFVKNTYNHLFYMGCKEVILEEFIDYTIDTLYELISGKVNMKELIMIRGLGANYKNNTYFMKVFAEELHKLGKTAEPGDRLDYVIVKSDERLLGKRMRDPETFTERIESSQSEQIDYVYYIEHFMMKIIEQLFYAVYRDRLDTMATLIYKPQGRYHPISILHPIKMALRLIAEGRDFRVIKEVVRKFQGTLLQQASSTVSNPSIGEGKVIPSIEEVSQAASPLVAQSTLPVPSPVLRLVTSPGNQQTPENQASGPILKIVPQQNLSPPIIPYNTTQTYVRSSERSTSTVTLNVVPNSNSNVLNVIYPHVFPGCTLPSTVPQVVKLVLK